MAIRALVFDAYGTLYDVQSVRSLATDLCGDKGEIITHLWRLKQLEYTWLRTLMRTGSLTATYAVASNCTVEATATLDGSPPLDLAFLLTSKGFLYVTQTTGVIAQGFGVKQGSPICTNAGVEGSYGLETTGTFLAGAPAIGPVAFIGELELLVNPSNPSGEGMISGQLAGTENGTILMFAKEPVTGSYTIGTNCWGRATIKPKSRSAMHFSLLVVDGGKEMLAIETDANTVVSGTLQRSRPSVSNGFQSGPNDDSGT